MLHDPERRALLLRAALLLGAGALPLGACRGSCGRTPASTQAQSLEPAAWATVEAATARLIPTDDLPGAREANVVGFIDRQLALPHFAVFKDEFRVGVGVLDVLALAHAKSRFVALDVTGQDDVLTALADGDGSVHGFDAAHFFDVLFTFTLEGMFSDPVHGGNVDQAGWRLLGYAPGGPGPGHHHG
ncbi:MAG: gluconate 2-dehydrogenase subunit 3 family protein [Deltaproteobacteria bacterium]|nr:gluconate 2-dehydrogenase subunit 3 family protein [Deltaproteobacteria bacterium]